MNLCIARIGERRVAIDGSVVRRVAPIGPITRLPRSPEQLAGLVADRGLVLPLIDPLALLGEPRESAPGRQMVVLNTPLGDLALRVDAVLTFGAVAMEAAEEAPASTASRFIVRGFVYDGAPCLLLDSARIAAHAARPARGAASASSLPPSPAAPPR